MRRSTPTTLISMVMMTTLAAAGTAFAQAPAPPAGAPSRPSAAATDPALDAMAKARFLLGRWEGDGAFRMGPGEPHPARVTEYVHDRLGGRVLLLEGHGTTPGRDGGPPVTVHEAFGVLSYDPGAGTYLLRAWKRDGQFVDADVELGENRLVWGFDTAQGRVRYTLTLDDAGRWHEVGEIERGGSWMGFFEMKLSRVAED